MISRATMALGATASANATRVLMGVARAHHVDIAALAADVRLDVAILDDPYGRIPLRLQRRIWELASTRSRDSIFGLHVAEESRLGTFEALDYALWASATFADALERIGRFYRLLGDDLELHVVQRDSIARVHRAVIHDQRHRSECFFAVLALRARELLGQTFRLNEVRFAHRAPADIRPHRALFHCPVRFGCTIAELVFDAAHLGLPVTTARPGLATVLDRYMSDLLARLPVKDSFLHRVHDAVARSLHGGRPSLARTARTLHASPRTVQRRLQDLGVSHTDVVADVRRDMAERLLAAGRLSIAEVAYLLGFENASGFRRAYRRWTGTSPSRHRR